MYSQAGKPWTKTIVRDVTNTQDTTKWVEVNQLSKLSGQPVALNDIGINQNDLSNFISKTKKWDAKRISALQSFFSQPLIQHKLLIYKVSGSISNDSLKIQGTPFIFLSPDTTILLPSPH